MPNDFKLVMSAGPVVASTPAPVVALVPSAFIPLDEAVDYAKLSRELAGIMELSRNLPRCWHCQGKDACTCIVCARRVGVEVLPGPCGWCKTARHKLIAERLTELRAAYGVSEELMRARIEVCLTIEQRADFFAEPPPDLKRGVKRELPVDPKWDSLGERGQVAKRLHAAGLQSKGHRFADCDRTGIPYDCHETSCLLKGLGRYHCGNRFCEFCSPAIFQRLMSVYAGPVARLIAERRSHVGYALARLNFTMKATGEMPTPKEIKAFNRALRRALKQAVPKDGEGHLQYGVLWSDEFGFELRGRQEERAAGGLNLHAHALYYGPYLNWHRLREAWVEALRREGLEGQGIWITFLPKGWRWSPAKHVQRAFGHMFKYISKVPAKTPERIAGLEITFHRVRRVHAGGIFYALERTDEEAATLQRGSPPCPRCGQPMVRAYGRPWERFPIEDLEREGRRDLAELRREKVLALGAARVLYERGP